MAEIHNKPRLVFFQYKYKRLAPFLLLHQREHVDCLSQFFDVTLIQHDCDYRQICDVYKPDLVMFESGVPFNTCTRPSVRNLRAYPQVPKVGFLHADSFGEGRTGFLSDMDHWGIETFFTIATTAAEHTPALAAKFIVWPNFVNPELHREYGQTKTIDVLFTGNKNNLYPWRRKMIEIVPNYYQSVISAHPGYIPEKESAKILVGEAYARMLNSAWMVPACGAVAKEIVRKHFEVPACGSCLVTEKSAALEAAGFVDMQNCVFADENDVVEKLGYLLEHRDVLRAITDAGHELVHSRHTIRERNQVLQWFLLNKNLKAEQKIIQTNPFEPLQITDRSIGKESIHVRSNGGLVTLLRAAGQSLWHGDYVQAEKKYVQCATYYRYMPEPLLGLTLCNLFQGRPNAALKYIAEPLEATLADYKAIDPDPVEWAYFIVVLLCLGKMRQAVKRSQEFEWLRHPELDRVRWMVSALSRKEPMPKLSAEAQQSRLTVHQMPTRSIEKWLHDLSTMFSACGRAKLAQDMVALTTQTENAKTPAASALTMRVDEAELRRAWSRKRPFIYLRSDACGFFSRRRLYSCTLAKSRQAAKTALRCPKALLKISSAKENNQVAPTIHQPRPSSTYCERGA